MSSLTAALLYPNPNPEGTEGPSSILGPFFLQPQLCDGAHNLLSQVGQRRPLSPGLRDAAFPQALAEHGHSPGELAGDSEMMGPQEGTSRRLSPAGSLLKEGFKQVMASGWLSRGFCRRGREGLAQVGCLCLTALGTELGESRQETGGQVRTPGGLGLQVDVCVLVSQSCLTL